MFIRALKSDFVVECKCLANACMHVRKSDFPLINLTTTTLIRLYSYQCKIYLNFIYSSQPISLSNSLHITLITTQTKINDRLKRQPLVKLIIERIERNKRPSSTS